MASFKLNFNNRSDDAKNNSVVIFQKGTDEDFGDKGSPWVTKETLLNHPFQYPLQFQVEAREPNRDQTSQRDPLGE